MQVKILYLWLGAGLVACSQADERSASVIQSHTASMPMASSHVNMILHSDNAQDNILDARKIAKQSVLTDAIASEVTPNLSDQNNEIEVSSLQKASDATLPTSCEQYFRRTEACFAKQGEDATALLQMQSDARYDLAQQNPDEATCVALNQSFDAVARNLACE